MAEAFFYFPFYFPSLEVTDSEIQSVLRDMAVEKITTDRFLRSILDGFAVIEGLELRVTDIVMGSADFSFLRRHNANNLEVSTHTSELEIGLMGWIFGARIWVRRHVDQPICFSGLDPEFRRRFPDIVESYERMLNVERQADPEVHRYPARHVIQREIREFHERRMQEQELETARPAISPALVLGPDVAPKKNSRYDLLKKSE